MDIQVTELNDIKVLAVKGRMDASSVADFDANWKKLLEAGAAKIIVDFSGLEYISSAGLRGVLMLAKTAKVKKAAIIFSGMQSMVADMFRISGFIAILQTAPDAASAAKKLG